jgi:hypothetical protein
LTDWKDAEFLQEFVYSPRFKAFLQAFFAVDEPSQAPPGAFRTSNSSLTFYPGLNTIYTFSYAQNVAREQRSSGSQYQGYLGFFTHMLSDSTWIEEPRSLEDGSIVEDRILVESEWGTGQPVVLGGSEKSEACAYIMERMTPIAATETIWRFGKPEATGPASDEYNSFGSEDEHEEWDENEYLSRKQLQSEYLMRSLQ